MMMDEDVSSFPQQFFRQQQQNTSGFDHFYVQEEEELSLPTIMPSESMNAAVDDQHLFCAIGNVGCGITTLVQHSQLLLDDCSHSQSSQVVNFVDLSDASEPNRLYSHLCNKLTQGWSFSPVNATIGGAMFIFDASNADSFHCIPHWIDSYFECLEASEWCEEVKQQPRENQIICIVACKLDLVPRFCSTREEDYQSYKLLCQARDFARNKGYMYAEVSSIESYQLTDLRQKLFQCILQKNNGVNQNGHVTMSQTESAVSDVADCRDAPRSSSSLNVGMITMIGDYLSYIHRSLSGNHFVYATLRTKKSRQSIPALFLTDRQYRPHTVVIERLGSGIMDSSRKLFLKMTEQSEIWLNNSGLLIYLKQKSSEHISYVIKLASVDNFDCLVSFLAHIHPLGPSCIREITLSRQIEDCVRTYHVHCEDRKIEPNEDVISRIKLLSNTFTLNLNGLHLGSTHIQIVLEAIKWSSDLVQTIDLSDNNLVDNGLESIVASLSGMNRLNQLSLRHNCITHVGIRVLCTKWIRSRYPIVPHPAIVLDHLDLSYNASIGDIGCNLLLRVLSWQKLQEESYEQYKTANNTVIVRTLDLSHNQLSDKILPLACESIHNHCLDKLNLSGNCISGHLHLRLGSKQLTEGEEKKRSRSDSASSLSQDSEDEADAHENSHLSQSDTSSLVGAGWFSSAAKRSRFSITEFLIEERAQALDLTDQTIR